MLATASLMLLLAPLAGSCRRQNAVEPRSQKPRAPQKTQPPGQFEWPNLHAIYPLLKSLGPPKVYEFAPMPALRYQKPNIGTWLAALRPASSAKQRRAVHVWRADGKAKFVRLSEGRSDARGHGEFYALLDDSRIERVNQIGDDGRVFITQVGVCRWSYRYERGVLAEYRSFIGSNDGTANKLYRIDTFDYWPGTATPHYTYHFKDDSSRKRGAWIKKIEHDRNGKAAKTTRRPPSSSSKR